MGKRDTRYAFMNPIAMARARGPVSNGGPSIKDYMNRDRPSWEEVKEILEKKKGGSKTLAAWEDKMNEKFREELRRNREKLLGESSCEEKKVKKKRESGCSEESFEEPTGSSKHKHKKSKKKKQEKYKHEHRKHNSSSSPTSSSYRYSEDSLEARVSGCKRKHKKSKKNKKDKHISDQKAHDISSKNSKKVKKKHRK
ncbi:protein FAM133B [Caerostris extrusa]|uniref:Protein FAM133B n=1 Tax=Caerostris extrusa TaxID=172846 RepID=A0AAV4MME1_CAEEX|nr:protein FAM133B [Caerostris extrusa]